MQTRTTKVSFCVAVFFGFANIIPMVNTSFETLPHGGVPTTPHSSLFFRAVSPSLAKGFNFEFLAPRSSGQ